MGPHHASRLTVNDSMMPRLLKFACCSCRDIGPHQLLWRGCRFYALKRAAATGTLAQSERHSKTPRTASRRDCRECTSHQDCVLRFPSSFVYLPLLKKIERYQLNLRFFFAHAQNNGFPRALNPQSKCQPYLRLMSQATGREPSVPASVRTGDQGSLGSFPK